MLRQLGTACTVVAEEDGAGGVILVVSGPETALVIGRRGQTLDAIEYVVNRVVSRDEDLSEIPRFVVDAEGYRGRRREYLEELAARLCEKVEKTGRAVTLNPMTPRDRRIVHLAVQKHVGLTSRSHGDGHLRSMMILPEGRERRPSRGSGRAAD
jgi:spoIIIJ-associated protein